MQIDKCAICGDDFQVSKMKDGKCDRCFSQFPGIKNKEELEKMRTEKQEEGFNKGNLPNIIKTNVDKILEEYGILIKCECGTLYHKRSPAQKKCSKCGDKE